MRSSVKTARVPPPVLSSALPAPYTLGTEQQQGEKMESKVTVRIEFLDGRQIAEDYSMTFPPGQEEAAAFKVIADMRMMGGYVKRGGGSSITLFPMESIKLITAEASAIALGDMSDLAQLTQPNPNKIIL